MSQKNCSIPWQDPYNVFTRTGDRSISLKGDPCCLAVGVI
jgi:hypothetical protein